MASRRFRFGFHSAEFWHTTRSSDRIEPTKRSSTNSSPIETTWISKKLVTWEGFYNYDRPHDAHSGKTPYEVLREKLR